MKKIYFFAIVTLLAIGAKAQDTIVFKNGDELKVKVTEVSDTQIKYHMWNNQSGPVYTKNVSEIFMVKYKGGYKEVYGKQQQQQQQQPQQQQNNYNQNQNQYGGYIGQGRMEHESGDLLLDGRKLSDNQIKDLLGINGYNTYASAAAQRRSGNSWVTWGWIETGVGLGFMVLDILADLDGELAIYGAILFLAGQIELPIGYVLRGVGNGRLNWLADNYNNGGQMSQNISLSIGPSLVCAPTATGSTNYALGAGLQLRF